MLGEILEHTISQLAILYLFLILGFFFSRFGFMKDQSVKSISVLLANFFLPCMLLDSISKQLQIEYLSKYFIYMIAGILILLVLWVPTNMLASKLMHSTKKDDYGMSAYAMLFPNISFLGYPLVKVVLPDAYLPLVFFGLSFTVIANTFGLGLLSDTPPKFSWRQVISPAVIGTVLGILFAVLPFSFPSFLEGFLSSSSSCTGPLAMLFTGLVIGKTKLVFKGNKTRRNTLVLTVLIRLVLLPLVFGIIAFWVERHLPIDNVLFVVVVAGLCLPCGMNMLFLKKTNNGEESLQIGAQCVLLTNVFAMLTVPFIYSLLNFFTK